MSLEPASPDRGGSAGVAPRLGLRSETGADSVTIWLAGDVDHSTAPQLLTYSEGVIGPSCRQLVLDCSDMSFMDSGGLRVLVALGTDVLNEGELVLRNASSTVRRILQVTGLDEVFALEPPLARN